MKNILLVVVDCMRQDYAYSRDKMPAFYEWLRDKFIFKNHWATSHCTDPCMTHMLTGKHPDELGLYSMMYEDKNYDIPTTVDMLSYAAARCGFTVGMLTNLGRWYQRGVGQYVDTSGWNGHDIVLEAGRLMQTMQQPWFITVHLADMHKPYKDGSYMDAAKYESAMLKSLLETAPLYGDVNMLVTADHGEALGEHDIVGHGYGLWDCITHIPMVIADGERRGSTNLLTDSGTVNLFLRQWMMGEKVQVPRNKTYVYQVGFTTMKDEPRGALHFGVVYKDKSQYILQVTGDQQLTFCVPNVDAVIGKEPDALEVIKKEHRAYGHSIDDLKDSLPDEVMERLTGLGYFDQE